MKRFFAVFAAALLLLTLNSCSAEPQSYTGFAMGSVLNASLYNKNAEEEDLWQRIAASVDGVDCILSSSKEDSVVSVLNRNKRVSADANAIKLFADTVTVCNLCGRKTDITLGALTEKWGFSTDSPRVPSEDEIKEALSCRNIEEILIDEDSLSVETGEKTVLDFGAVGKGAGLDAAYNVLTSQTSPAVVTFGGSVLLFGENPSGGSWKIGIRNPYKGENDYFATVDISVSPKTDAAFVSTSGSYEKTFTEAGKTYHHILSPETGYPVENGLKSVSVIASGGLVSDALSTACFVNGFCGPTLELLDNFSAEAVFVFDDNTYIVTDGLKENFTLTDSSFSER